MTTYGKLFILIASCLGNEEIFNVLLPPFQIVDSVYIYVHCKNCVPRKAKMIYNLEGMEYNIKENISIISIVS